MAVNEQTQVVGANVAVVAAHVAVRVEEGDVAGGRRPDPTVTVSHGRARHTAVRGRTALRIRHSNKVCNN